MKTQQQWLAVVPRGRDRVQVCYCLLAEFLLFLALVLMLEPKVCPKHVLSH